MCVSEFASVYIRVCGMCFHIYTQYALHIGKEMKT